MASGITCPCYLASVGYFQVKFKSELLFGTQVASVVLAHFLAIFLEEQCGRGAARSPPQPGGPGASLQLGALSAAACAVMLSIPSCSSKAAVLLTGVLTSAIGTWLFAASIRLGAAVGGSLFVNAGFSLGSLAAAILVSVASFGPRSSHGTMYGFYLAGAGICALGSGLWMFFPICRCLSGTNHSAAGDEDRDWDEEAEPSESRRRLLGPAASPQSQLALPPQDGRSPDPAYGAGGGLSSGDEAHHLGGRITALFVTVSATIFTDAALCMVLSASGILLSLSSGFALLPLFPLVGPQTAVVLHQMKCVGDFLGRLLAIFHSSECAAIGRVGGKVRCCLVAAVAFRLFLVFLVMAWLLAGAHAVTNWLAPILVVGIFCVGGYTVYMLDLDAQLSVSETKRRYVVQWNRFIMIIGHVTGLTVGLALVLSA